ncbi:MMPL family transporter [Nocardioides rubriscoriae]|uniref:MMPL family transporter n=1 Tax=Nocardioides rubriscoriae TaxID=642762 RepID=UPI0011E05565|nr:MMPL family transporter [Nocardioides rubriscoriae]
MATYLYRLGRTAYRRWPFFIAGWLTLLVVVAGAAAGFGKPFNDAFTIPGIPSEKAATLQSELFPGSEDAFARANVNVVVAAPEGDTLSQPKYQDAIATLVDDLSALPQVSSAEGANPQLGNPVDLAKAQSDAALTAADKAGTDPQVAQANAQALSPLSADGRAGIIAFDLDVDSPTDVEQATIDALDDAMQTARDAGLTVEANGSGSQVQAFGGGAAEAIGIAIALVVLLLTFGSLVAAGMPILTAVFGVAIGLTGVTAMTALMDLNSSTTALSSMIGLAVGIDYTLFILARYRSELRHTDDRQQAVGIAVGTAGSAVVFAGLTVLIALSALSVVRIPFLTSMGLAAAGTVLIAVLVALTLLPAVLGMTKSKAFGGQVREYRPAHEADGQVLNNGVRWARVVGKRPLAAALLVVVALGALALPLKGLHLAFPSDSTAASETTQRKASDLMSAEFGPGREGPLLVVVDGRGATDPSQAFADVAAWASGQDGVANAQVVGTNADPSNPDAVATGALIQVLPEAGPDDEATQDLLDSLRDGQSGIEQQTATTIGVTGLTAITTDVSDRLAGALPIYLAIVVGLAFILLMIVFRSLLVPLTATAGFLLSVLATLGATVAIFQEGTFGLFEPQPIVSFIPIFLIGVVFGLAMDYQVFLVTRIREAHVHGMSTRDAVVDGFRNSARVVAAAAAIMTAVFSGFILEDDAIIKSMGFALAAAVVFDAFVVRMVLIPALMYLMGEKAWYLPAWLDKVLPNVDVEGEHLPRPYLTDREVLADDGDHEPVLVG